MAYKKVIRGDGGEAILKLLIPADAKRSNAPGGRKIRVSAARVLTAENASGEPIDASAILQSGRDSSFIYRVGEIVSVDNFDEVWTNECSTGIHCFLTREEAVEYRL